VERHRRAVQDLGGGGGGGGGVDFELAAADRSLRVIAVVSPGATPAGVCQCLLVLGGVLYIVRCFVCCLSLNGTARSKLVVGRGLVKYFLEDLELQASTQYPSILWGEESQLAYI